jgi:hypothetical protein
MGGSVTPFPLYALTAYVGKISPPNITYAGPVSGFFHEYYRITDKSFVLTSYLRTITENMCDRNCGALSSGIVLYGCGARCMWK